MKYQDTLTQYKAIAEAMGLPFDPHSTDLSDIKKYLPICELLGRVEREARTEVLEDFKEKAQKQLNHIKTSEKLAGLEY